MCLAIPGEVVAVHDDRPDLATVDVSGVRRRINIGLLGDDRPEPGEWVLIHVGFAMSTIDEHEARATLEFLESIGQSYADEVAALRDRLGPDPLRSDADPDRAWRRISRSRTSIAALLMDQKVLAGVGNVYRAEVLFRHGIPPHTPGRELGEQLWKLIWDDLVELMADGVRVGRIDTVRPEHEPEVMGRPAREDRHGGEVYVYRRAGAPCLVCGTPVSTEELSGRKLYWCPVCQAG